MTSAQPDRRDPGARLARLYAGTRRAPSQRTQRVLLVVAAVVFVVGGWLSLDALDVTPRRVSWLPLAVVAVAGVPLTLLANTLEYMLSARMLGHRAGLLVALRLTVTATAANLLPIPGAFIVRVQGLRSMGAGYGSAAGSTAVIGLVWIGVSATLAAALLVPSRRWLPVAILAVGGVTVLVAAHAWLGRTAPAAERHRLEAMTVAVELFAVVVNAGRLVLILVGLGIAATAGQALVLAVAGSLAAAVGLFPGGFGLREAIAALLAPLVGLAASAGFAVTAINRVIGIIVLAPVALGLAAGRAREPGP